MGSLRELAKVLPQRINGHASILFMACLKFSRVTSDAGNTGMPVPSAPFVSVDYS
jgi:hypothetical protein